MRDCGDFTRQFLRPGDLYFDIGAHVGNRIRAARQIGARVVAVEPNPELTVFLKALVRRRRCSHSAE